VKVKEDKVLTLRDYSNDKILACFAHVQHEYTHHLLKKLHQYFANATGMVLIITTVPLYLHVRYSLFDLW
jgi:hypothetical protein